MGHRLIKEDSPSVSFEERRLCGTASVMRRIDAYHGTLIGLAVGDAMANGQCTDHTSMALCLAESLLEAKGVVISDTVRQALAAFEQTRNPRSGATPETSRENGALMRLAPVALYFSSRDVDAIAMCGDSCLATHDARVAVDACRYLGALLVGALWYKTKEELLSPRYAPRSGYWDEHPLDPVIAEIADGSFKRKAPRAMRGSGDVAHTLEAVLWAFHQSSDFQRGSLMAFDLGENADAIATVYGQLAGAYYGESGIPERWRKNVAMADLITNCASRLFLSRVEVPAVRDRSYEKP